jgi:8-oxo-dGTP pyrophosphatase MutT (NUDIX family)
MASRYYNQQQQCGNCGKTGHVYRECTKPITSYGIICIGYHKNDRTQPQLLLVQRKFSIGMMEFIRGKYETHNEAYIIKLFGVMSVNEKDNILAIRNYDILRAQLGPEKNLLSYKREYIDGKQKFNTLLEHNTLDRLITYSKSHSANWPDTEWGLPKGRRTQGESNLECAIREFQEETSVPTTDFIVYSNIIPLEEIYTSINNITYKHTYYIAEYVKPIDEPVLEIKETIPEQYNEIANIKWLDETSAFNMIRPYYHNKLAVIAKSLQIIKALPKYFE